MTHSTTLRKKDAMIYLQSTLHVSRKELLDTIRFSRVSAMKIAEYVKKRKSYIIKGVGGYN